MLYAVVHGIEVTISPVAARSFPVLHYDKGSCSEDPLPTALGIQDSFSRYVPRRDLLGQKINAFQSLIDSSVVLLSDSTNSYYH